MGFSIDEILSTKTSDIVLESSFNRERQYLCYQQNGRCSTSYLSKTSKKRVNDLKNHGKIKYTFIFKHEKLKCWLNILD